MRNLSFILIFIILVGCSEEPVNVPTSLQNPNWSKIIYETSDIGTIEINNSSKVTAVFRNNFYDVLSSTGSLTRSPKESFEEFDLMTDQSLVPLRSDDKFVLSGVDNSGVIPRYGVKLMDNEQIDAFSYFHDNVHKGTFLPADRNIFYGLLESPIYVDSLGSLALDVTIIEFTYGLGGLDTLSSHVMSLPSATTDQSITRAVINGDEIFFTNQSSIVRYNVSDQTSVTMNLDGEIENIFLIGNQIVAQVGSLKLEVYSFGLVKQSDVELQGLVGEQKAVKNTILKIYEKDDKIYIVSGLSEVKERNENFLEEVAISVELSVLDQNLSLLDQFLILESTSSDSGVLWEKYDLISLDVRSGNFAIFMFQSEFLDSSFEYLIKRVNLN